MDKRTTLEQVKKNLQEELQEDLKTALKETQTVVSEQSPKYESLNLLIARYYQNQQAEIKNEDRNNIRIEYNRIRKSLSDIISNLREKDIVKASPATQLSDLERVSIEKRIHLLSRKMAKLQERLIRIEGTDASMEFRLEEEIEEAATQLQKLKAQL